MKTRLFLIILILVVAPTALLSVLASRALRARELTLQNELETRAENAIKTTASRVRTRLEDDLDHVRVALLDSVSHGGKYHDAEVVATRLADSRDLVAHVYLFLHPWGLMYPQEADYGLRTTDDAEGIEKSTRLRPGWDFLPTEGWPGGYDDLLAELRRGVGRRPGRQGAISFRLDDAGYCFAALEAGKPLHAGYAIDEDAFLKLLSETIAAVSGEDFFLAFDLPGRETSGVIVTDGFGEVAHSPTRPFARSESTALASSPLLPPFSQVTLTAYLEDPEGIAASGRFYARLFSWGILLLAAGICAGVWIVVQQAATEIQRVRVRSDFVIGVSHDLRTPISSMKMMAESLAMDRVPDKDRQKQFHEVIAREADRLADMIERVLFFMREEQGASVYCLVPTDVAKIARDAVRDLVERQQGNVSVDLKLADNLPQVNADAGALEKVIFNLLDNALKYSSAEALEYGPRTTDHPAAPSISAGESGLRRAGGPRSPICITVDTVIRRSRTWVRLAVSDSGIGIGKKELKKVFRKFYRASLEAEGKVGGIGLGLAICRSVIRAHKGRITAESRPGEGSTFTIYLPVIG